MGIYHLGVFLESLFGKVLGFYLYLVMRKISIQDVSFLEKHQRAAFLLDAQIRVTKLKLREVWNILSPQVLSSQTQTKAKRSPQCSIPLLPHIYKKGKQVFTTPSFRERVNAEEGNVFIEKKMHCECRMDRSTRVCLTILHYPFYNVITLTKHTFLILCMISWMIHLAFPCFQIWTVATYHHTCKIKVSIRVILMTTLGK